ncbi:hypothetical protein KJ359_012776 [Pestalotiopsis sp. 9143b]|nr:hypothetical protein KJ359_012776 [Pestalotiopsis sp. 9143b]
MDGETTADESASGNSQTAQTAASAQPLHDARRPQRLFAKVNVAMNLVKKRLSDNKYTMIGEFPYAVLRATEENWHLFGSNDDTGDLDIDGTIWDGDETVLSELVFAPFYEE